MDTVEAMKREADQLETGGTWRENDVRLVWCGKDASGSYTFRNTTSAISKGPIISEAHAARLLAEEGPWRSPTKFAA